MNTPLRRSGTSHIEIRFTGKTGQIDGYVEMMLGILVMSNMLRAHHLTKKTRPNGTTVIYLDVEVMPPPLGHLGEGDIDER